MFTEAKCWICNNPADSAEHRLKKADIVRAYGKGPYKKETGPVYFRGGVQNPIQGPGSARIKYAQSICRSCNTTRTQPYDRAYDCLIDWVLANEAIVIRKRLLNFENIYGQNWPEDQLNLFKYFVKSFGCRMVDDGLPVPQDLIDLLSMTNFSTALKITFCVNEDVLMLFDEATRSSYFGKGQFAGWAAKNAPLIPTDFKWREYVSWFTILYWYGFEPEGGCGSTWIANSQYVYLGGIAPLPAEMRAEALSKKAASN